MDDHAQAPSSLSWKELADQKKREWRNVLESRIEELEQLLVDKESLLQVEKSKFNETKEHFKYNLKLLEERDRELEKYDVLFADIKGQLNSKSAEISELKIHVDDLKNVIQREEKMKDEMQSNYQRRLREKQIEVDSYKSSKDGELNDERQEYEKFRRNLQRQLTNVQNELDTQKRELTIEFESEIKKREHEFRVQSDELNAKVLEHELKVKLLEKELSLVRESNDKTQAKAEDAQTEQQNLQKIIKKKEWELADMTAVKDSQIAELKNKLSSSESSMKKLQEDFQRKYIEMDKTVREKEETIDRVKNGYLEREQTLLEESQSLLSKLEDAQIKERQLSWTIQDVTKEKELQIEKLQDEVRDIKEKWDRHVSEISRDKVTRDLELANALEEQRRLKSELDQRKDDLNRYKNELKLAAEREENLDRQKTQIDLDWQRRTEDIESQQYQKSEDLIERLSTAKTSAEALVKERERELQHKILLIKSLSREKDQLRAVLKKHDIPLDNFIKYSLDEKEGNDLNYVEDLQKQNEGLRDLVSHMRVEMESLVQGLAPNHVVMERIQDLKKQDDKDDKINELRRENQKLMERLTSSTMTTHLPASAPSRERTEEILSEVHGNTMVRSHILALNEAIGSLRSEKVELAATAKKQQARISYLENALEQSSKQPRLKQLEIDQLTYEMNNLRRRSETESVGMKNRISELELQLSEARREADEYHRASLERNQELVALGNQLSALKMEMTENNPSINFGAQELYIQQLQTELSQLRKRSAAVDLNNSDALDKRMEDGNFSSSDCKVKLKSAAVKIVQLAKENQQLIESNNRLRAELKTQASASAKANRQPEFHFNASVHQTKMLKDSSPSQSESEARGRLSQLEQLQYELTKKELLFAHRFQPDKIVQQQPRQNGSGEELERDTQYNNNIGHDNRLFIPSTQSTLSSFPANESSTGELDARVLMSLSSAGGESIQKVWQMLEESVPSVSASPKSVMLIDKDADDTRDNQSKSKERDKFVITGQKASARLKSMEKSNPRIASKNYSKSSIKVPTVSKPKVRNYNIQDDRYSKR